jgi:hypothetical protein
VLEDHQWRKNKSALHNHPKSALHNVIRRKLNKKKDGPPPLRGIAKGVAGVELANN